MCSIAGIIGFEAHDLYEILMRDQHRGPDGMGKLIVDKDFIIGHNRLSIIDLSHEGKQPMESERYIMSVNGEIYNYKELANIKGNDCKTLLAYFEKHGIDKTLRDINGMFAIALYDKAEEKLHLIVDRFAQKPLYYHSTWQHGAPHFAFASSPAALTGLLPSKIIDKDALQTYWMLGSVMGEQSIFAGIKKVEGATHLIYDVLTGRISKETYWQPQYRSNHEDMGDLIIDAIQKVQVADVPVSLFLSGGIDSTLVASQMKGKSAIHLESPEVVYAQEAAAKFEMDMRIVKSGNVDVEAILQDHFHKSGELSFAAIIPYIAAREASKYFKVGISANGADELFYGYDRTHQKISIQQSEHLFRMGFAKEKLSTWPLPYDDRLSEGSWIELKRYVECDLNKTLDFASMAHGLEMRCPFLDHRLVELALSIPEADHRGGYGSKAILKNMLKKMGFGNNFLTRDKIGFSLHEEPPTLSAMKNTAHIWCDENGFLPTWDYPKFTRRDEIYTKSAALGFYHWFKVWMK